MWNMFVPGWSLSLGCAAIVVSAGVAAAGDLAVVGIVPASNATAAPVGSPIVVRFNQPVNRATVTDSSLWAFARSSGTVRGSLTFSDGDATVTLTPDRPFAAGESVMVFLSRDLRGADGSPMRAAGYSWMFWTRPRPSRLDFVPVQSMTTRTNPGSGTRSYGGVGADLNGNGWLDLSIINEDSADVRVFMNRADGSGLFHPFTQPPFPVGRQASPNEAADFNRDGHVDLVVVNIAVRTVSILLGNGDGSFRPQQQVMVGNAPRGVAVLDADGDGDMDVVNTNSSSSNLSVLLNDGSGTFGFPTYFDGGLNGEWALGAADMTGDGILDLVCAARTGQQAVVLRGNGNGTFTPLTPQSSGGAAWMLACGDVNGDGHADVATANSSSNNGAILLGNGAGGLGSPRIFAVDPFPLACDLGDLDGDGDLDWVLSSFNGDWSVMANDGAGVFTRRLRPPAPQAASCAVLFDTNNDGALDMALIDELADTVDVWHNSCYADCDQSTGPGVLDIFDWLCWQTLWTGGASYACDCDTSTGNVACDIFDFLCYGNAFDAGCP